VRIDDCQAAFVTSFRALVDEREGVEFDLIVAVERERADLTGAFVDQRATQGKLARLSLSDQYVKVSRMLSL
jgi:hypothetical protein